jgi:hypothetical protein
MSEENQNPSGETQEVSDVQEQETKKTNDTVAYSTYSKVLGEKKKMQEQLGDAMKRLEQIELEKKQADGNKDEVIQQLRSKLEEAENGQQKLKHQYAWTTLEGQIKSAAAQKGCVNPDKLIRLLDENDLKAIEVDDSFKVNNDDLDRLLDKAKKDHSDIGLFGKKQVNVNDVTPKPVKHKEKKVEEMTASELKEYIKTLE